MTRAFVASLLLAALVACAGCSTRSCKQGTLLLSVTLSGGAAGADSLSLDISVDGGGEKVVTVAVPSGASGGTVEVDFSSYPAGRAVTIAVTATAGGNVVGAQTASVTLAPSCGTLSVDVGGGVAGGDDLAGVDACVPSVTTCPADACGSVDDGCGHPVDCGRPCQLTALRSPVAASNDVVTLEGTFSTTATVNFPGGVKVDATILGPHRATAHVPAAATAGDLTVATGGMTLGPVPFRHAPFTPDLGFFDNSYTQTDAARPMPGLGTGRNFFDALVVGDWIYAIGGGTLNVERARIEADGALSAFSQAGTLTMSRGGAAAVAVGNSIYVLGGSTVERATVNADGTLNQFALLGGVSLVTPRSLFTVSVVGNSLYVIGGWDASNMPLGTVERATINPDGTLSTFATVAGVTLTTPRSQHATVVVGNSIYVIGGAPMSGLTGTVERATIAGDGSISTFTTVTGVSLMTPREGTVGVVLGNKLFVFGGYAMGPLTSIESATIAADGTLSTFATSTVKLLNVRESPAIAVVGNWLYALGGYTGFSSSRTVERAPIDAGASLAAFAPPGGVTMNQPREGFATAVIGHYVYAIGGSAGGINLNSLNSVERATVQPDGSLSTFSIINGVTLMMGRRFATAAIIGNTLYVIGGSSGLTPTGTVESATINADGTISTFATVSGVTLMTPRTSHTSVAVGGVLYVIGGSGSGGALNTVESSTITNGALGAFATVSGVTLATGRYSHVNAVVGDKLWLFGGFTTTAIASVESTAAPTSGLSAAFTTSTAALSTPRSGPAAAVVGDYVFVVGGSDQNGTVLPSSERGDYDVAGTVSTLGTVPGVTLTDARQSFTVVVLGNYAHAIGGYAGSAAAVPFPPAVERSSLP